ncbi:MAG: tyrosine-type recombinase/integrase [Kiloniellaceae bacterium]
MPKLTKNLVASACAKNGDLVLWDESPKGFGLRVKTSGAKTFIIQYRNRSGRSRRYSIAQVGKLTLEEARKQATRLLGQIALGSDPAEERRMMLKSETVTELADLYMKKHCQDRCKPRTIAAHKWLIKKFIKPKLGNRRLLELRPSDVTKLHNDLRKTPYNANRMLGLLRAMFNKAERWEIIPRGANPAAFVQPFPEKKRERYLTAEELKRLLNTIDDLEKAEELERYAAAAFRLLIFTGCRLGEIQTLEWKSVDFAHGCLVLRRHKGDKHGDKIIPLNPPALQILRGLPREKKNPHVIVGREPEAHLTDLQKPWRKVRGAADLDDVRLHDLRHSFASFAVGAGLSLPIIGALLGHKSLQATARYAHLAQDPLKQATDMVGVVLTAAPNVQDIKNGAEVVRPPSSMINDHTQDHGTNKVVTH